MIQYLIEELAKRDLKAEREQHEQISLPVITIEKLKEAFRIYGGHCGGCKAVELCRSDLCTCGFKKIWDSIK
jgi:hypothetical protein